MVRKWLSNWTLMALSVFLLEMIFFSIFTPHFLSFDNMSTMLTNFLVIGIMAVSMTFVIISGGIDLSVGSIMSLCGVIMGLIWQAGVNIWLAGLLAIAVGGMAGFINGLLIVRTGIQPLIATLATLFIYSSLALVIGGENSISGFPEEFLVLGVGRLFGIIPLQLLIFAVIALFFGFLLQKTVYGHLITFIGNNEASAFYSGVPVNAIKIWTYICSGLTAGLSAVILGSYFASVRGDMGYQYEFLVITACLVGGVNVFGGAGTISGVVIGTFILGMLGQGLNMLNISSVEQKIITGVILLLAVAIQQIDVYISRQRRTASPIGKEVKSESSAEKDRVTG
ncbi:MAG TPA: ABC transporter permease [Brevibacillus sp.]|nr:ABC transporter permease [Brevibacillus sp.]